MKSFTIAILAAASASASTLFARQGIPNCAATCITGAKIPDGCSPTDNGCLCRSPEFVQSTSDCVKSTCSGDDLTQAEALAQQLCASEGVTLSDSASSPTQTSGSSGSATNESSASAPAQTAAGGTGNNGALSNGAHIMASLAGIGLVALAL